MYKKFSNSLQSLLKANYLNIFIVAFLLLIGFLLRSKPYLSGNFNYFLDQSRDLLLTKQIVVDHNVTLIGARAGIDGVFHGPIWLYMIAPFFYISRGNPFFTLIPLFIIINSIPIVLAYFAGYKLYDRVTGVMWGLFMAISSMLIDPSFITSNAQVMPIIFLAYVISMISFLRGKDLSFVSLMLFVGLGFHFESAFAIFLVPLTLMGLILYRKLPSIKSFLLGSFFMVLSVANFIIFELRHSFLMTNSILKLFNGSIPPFSDYKQLADINYRIVDRFLGLKHYFLTPLFQDNLIITIFVILFLIVACFLVYKKSNSVEDKKLKKEYTFVLAIPFLYYTIYIAYPFPLWGQYTLALSVSASLLLALSIKIVFDQYKSKAFLAIVVLFVTLPSLWWIADNYFGAQSKVEVFKNYKEQLEVANFIFNDNKNSDKLGYFVYDSGLLTYNMDYLMWYLGNTYKIKAVNEKLEYTYLILNLPPKWNKNDQKYWIENVIHTKGRVTLRKKFGNGMIVEKRLISKSEPPPDPNYFQNGIFR